jgi:hypothetical protein
MLGTPKGHGIGSPFFAYFLWRSKESELSPGNPRLGRKIAAVQPQSAGFALLSPPYNSRRVKEETPASASTSKQKCFKKPANIRPSLLKNPKL